MADAFKYGHVVQQRKTYGKVIEDSVAVLGDPEYAAPQVGVYCEGDNWQSDYAANEAVTGVAGMKVACSANANCKGLVAYQKSNGIFRRVAYCTSSTITVTSAGSANSDWEYFAIVEPELTEIKVRVIKGNLQTGLVSINGEAVNVRSYVQVSESIKDTSSAFLSK